MSARGTVLLIEDEPGLVRTLGDRLGAAGWEVRTALDGPTGLALASAGSADIILLDGMLPRLDGVEVLRQLRQQGITTPVIMLTARSEVANKVDALQVGADDYLTKPFRAVELLARMDAVLRRVRGGPLTAAEQQVRFGDWILDLEREELRRGAELAPLSRTEYDLLAYLVQHRGQPVPRAELLREVWRYAPSTASRTVDQHVAQLRRKLGGDRHLVTVHGRGYRFRE